MSHILFAPLHIARTRCLRRRLDDVGRRVIATHLAAGTGGAALRRLSAIGLLPLTRLRLAITTLTLLTLTLLTLT
ncbi:MAG: hypothetical protein EBR23_09370, partial [Planctomycetia bacterium]|nr:hypothetical protein [Planctomycetia bacterium]